MIDFTPVIGTAVSVLWWLLPLGLVVALLKSVWVKGWLGEAQVKLMATLRLPSKLYHRIHNVTLPTIDGTTQIDHVFISRFGIFVVETKNMSGWIFGSERQSQWTQKFPNRSFKFQNPLHQNYKHAKALEAVLEVSPNIINSVVVFVGASTFKTPMPPNVTYAGGYIRYIKSFTDEVLSESEVLESISRLQAHRLEPNAQTHKAHVQHLKQRSDPNADRTCPKCGSKMILRTVSRGANKGNKFWGCSSYPTCRMTQDIN